MTDTRTKKLAQHLSEQISDLLRVHLANIEDEATKLAHQTGKEAVGKVGISAEWQINGENTNVKLSYSVKHSDEIESKFDPDQIKLGLDTES